MCEDKRRENRIPIYLNSYETRKQIHQISYILHLLIYTVWCNKGAACLLLWKVRVFYSLFLVFVDLFLKIQKHLLETGFIQCFGLCVMKKFSHHYNEQATKITLQSITDNFYCWFVSLSIAQWIYNNLTVFLWKKNHLDLQRYHCHAGVIHICFLDNKMCSLNIIHLKLLYQIANVRIFLYDCI